MKQTQKARTFKKGVGNLKYKDYWDFRRDFMLMFGITTRVAYNNHLRGLTHHTEAEEIGIETLFARYGVAKKDVWD